MATETFPEDDCDCCGGAVDVGDCCDDVPATLCVTIENVSGAACLDGLEFQVQWDGGGWTSGPDVVPAGDCELILFGFICQDVEGTGYVQAVGSVRVVAEEGEAQFINDPFDAGDRVDLTCDPYSWTHTFTIDGPGTGLDGAVITVTVSECPP